MQTKFNTAKTLIILLFVSQELSATTARKFKNAILKYL